MKLFPDRKFWARHQDKAIAVVPKVGSTSLNLRVDGDFISIEQAKLIDVRVMFIRDPWDRHESCYSHFQALGPQDCGAIPREAIENGYEHYVDHMLNNPNPHWYPQMELTGGIATHLYKFNVDSIRKWWPTHWTGKQLDWMNATTHVRISDYRKSEILEYYAADIAAYEAAL